MAEHAPAPPPEPAERARTVLAAALCAELRWDDPTSDEPVRTAAGELVFVAPPLVTRPRPGRLDARHTVFIEVADAAPLPVRDRIRSRLRVVGHADPATLAHDVLRVRPEAVFLKEGGVTSEVPLRGFLTAAPDPLAGVEASVLTHLEAAHHEVVHTLSRLVDPAVLQGVVRVWPLAVDRCGLTLRLEYASRQRDVRLPFHEPVRDPDRLGAAMAALLTRARERVLPCRRSGLRPG